MRLPLAALAAMLLLGTAAALAHSWYDPQCCSERDCRPVPCDEISDQADGYHWDGLVFERSKAKPSQDKRCHVCILDRTTWGGEGRGTLCIYIQQGS